MEHSCAFSPCKNKSTGPKSLCSTHKSQRRRGKELTPVPPRLTPAERFWARVNKTETCWIWMAGYGNQGYGTSRFGNMTTNAHRISYMLAHGPIDRMQEVDHLCFNRACVNPSHLRLATRKQNGEHRQGPNSNSSSGILGVYFRKDTGKWQVRLMHNRKHVIVGCFTDKAEAEAAAIAKRNELFTHNALDRPAA